MTTSTVPAPGAPTAPQRAISPGDYDFLSSEMTLWRNSGLVDDDTAVRILGLYRPTRRFSLARLLLTLGAAFTGIGLIWLVASNLDQLPPLLRFGVVCVFWLALLVGAELLASRRAHALATNVAGGGSIPSPVVGAVRIMAALAFGAVVFQAAQSLQVPAFEPRLVGLWGLGALLYAYAVRGTGPLMIGVLAVTGWVISAPMLAEPSALTAVAALLAAGVTGASVSALHARRWPEFGYAWLAFGTILSLSGLFAAAIPEITAEDFRWSPTLIAIVVGTALVAGAALALARGRDRWEPLGALVTTAVGLLLVLWEAGANAQNVGAQDWAHAAVSVLLYVLVAGWFAVLGVLRDQPWLTWIATAFLVVFTTFQSFAVFAQIITGAWLFVVLGLIFVATGYLFDRARREVVATLDDSPEGRTR